MKLKYARFRLGRKRIWGALAVIAALFWIVTPWAMSPILRKHLEGMVAANLNAKLHMRSLTYHFPYGITIDEPSLISKTDSGEEVELIRARRIDLALAELPVGDGPLVIEKLIFTDPVIHLVNTTTGIVGRQGLVKEEGEEEGERGDKRRGKLSDIFRLRRLKIDNAEVVYEDRTAPKSPSLIWKNFRVDLNTNPTRGVNYAYSLVADDLPLAEIVASGTMDIDELVLDVKNFGMKLHIDPNAPLGQLPAALQARLRENHIDGDLTLSGSALAPLRHPGETRYDAMIDLSKASGYLAQWQAPVDHVVFKVHCTSELPVHENRMGGSRATVVKAEHTAASQPADLRSPPLYAHLEMFEAGSGGAKLKVESGSAMLDPTEGKWHVQQLSGTLEVGGNGAALPTQLEELLQRLNVRGKLEFSARASGPIVGVAGHRPVDDIEYELISYPRELTVQPPTFPKPLTHVSGAIHLKNNALSLENIQATYGADQIFIDECTLPIENLNREIHLRDLQGSITFAKAGGPTTHAGETQPVSPEYPPVLDSICSALHPRGTYFLSGECALQNSRPEGEPADYDFHYDFHLTSDSAGLAPGDRGIPLSEVRMDVGIRSDEGAHGVGAAEVREFQAKLCDGMFRGSGHLGIGKVFTYRARVEGNRIDLKQLADAWTTAAHDKPLNMSGKGYFNALVSGAGPRDGRLLEDNLRAKGEFEVLEGDFWEAPVVRDVIAGIKVARKALTIGQAAGRFNLYDRKFVIENAAISAPLIGLQGTGEIRLDGQIEARVVAAPLGDWRDKIKQTGIPVVSDAAGAFAGGIQKFLNSASGALIYEFRVTGTVAHPNLSTIPAPIITDTVAGMFGAMLNAGNDDHLIKVIRLDKVFSSTEPAENSAALEAR